MATFIFLWNADLWPEGDGWYRSAVANATPATPVREPWNMGARKGGLNAGDTAMLLRVRRERGLVASGVITGEVFERTFPDHDGKVVRYAEVLFEHVLPVDERIPTDRLAKCVAGVNWGRIQGAGMRVSDEAEPLLHQMWGKQLEAVGRTSGTGDPR